MRLTVVIHERTELPKRLYAIPALNRESSWRRVAYSLRLSQSELL
jgi:hypothetical protein